MVFNTYTLGYLGRLAPLPQAVKGAFLALLRFSRMGGIRLSVPLGNMYVIARRPA